MKRRLDDFRRFLVIDAIKVGRQYCNADIMKPWDNRPVENYKTGELWLFLRPRALISQLLLDPDDPTTQPDRSATFVQGDDRANYTIRSTSFSCDRTSYFSPDNFARAFVLRASPKSSESYSRRDYSLCAEITPSAATLWDIYIAFENVCVHVRRENICGYFKIYPRSLSLNRIK